MKRILCLSLALLLTLLCACASTPEETEPTPPPTETEAITDPPTDPPTAPPVLYRNPLTGEPMDQPMTARPFAVMMNNYKSALPIHGISQADILYEAVTEGGMTRCMGIFSDLTAAKNIGSIRSARRHFVSVALSYDAIYVHYGKSSVEGRPDVAAQQYMDQTGINHMDGTSKGYPYFFESKDRINAGYNRGDECHFLVGQRAIDYAKDNGFSLNRNKALDYGMKFDDEKVIVGKTANTVTAYFNEGGTPSSWTKYTRLEYDKATKTYLSFQFGQKNVDGNTGEQLAFRNVLVLKAKTTTYAGKLKVIQLEGTGEGYFACNGQLVPIKWSRKNAADPFTYTLEDGTPITFGVGKTYVAIVPGNATVTYQ